MTILPPNPIPEKVARYRKLKARLDAIKSEMDTLRAEIEPLVEATAESKWTDGKGYARIVQRKLSVSYDVKALDALLKSIPEIREAIQPHRRTRPGSRYLQIK